MTSNNFTNLNYLILFLSLFNHNQNPMPENKLKKKNPKRSKLKWNVFSVYHQNHRQVRREIHFHCRYES